MPGIDWAYLGSLGGEGLESFAATCLRQRYPDAVQTRPASGDEGIDVFRKTAEGLIVWQIKRFTAPVTSDQQRQIRRSWKRFWETNVQQGVRVASYALATPWTPTEGKRHWFLDEVCVDTPFDVDWEGEAFFNLLAADYPATADRFFKGHDMLENMVNAKAILASSPVETSDSRSMLDAIRAREAALRKIKDMVSDNYEIDTSIRRVRQGAEEIPLPPPGEQGLHHRYTRIDATRWQVESVVPKNVQSTEIEPLSLKLRFLVEPGSPEAAAVEQWRLWGVPCTDIPAETQQVGGPFADEHPVAGLISFGCVPVPQDAPRLMLTATRGDGGALSPLSFVVREITRGVEGDGLRVVASSRSHVVEVEARFGSSSAENEFVLRLNPVEGQEPSLVAADLRALGAIELTDNFECVVEGGAVVGAGTGLTPPPIASVVAQIAVDLTRLQPHTTERFLMPDVSRTTERQVDNLRWLANVYNGGAIYETWERLVFTLADPSFLTDQSLLNGRGALVMTEEPEILLGRATYVVTRTLAHQYLTPMLTLGMDRATLTAGDELELVPGDDNRLVHAAVVDDTETAESG